MNHYIEKIPSNCIQNIFLRFNEHIQFKHIEGQK